MAWEAMACTWQLQRCALQGAQLAGMRASALDCPAGSSPAARLADTASAPAGGG